MAEVGKLHFQDAGLPFLSLRQSFLYLLCDSIYLNVTFVEKIAIPLVTF
jgi:hypothetical protein